MFKSFFKISVLEFITYLYYFFTIISLLLYELFLKSMHHEKVKWSIYRQSQINLIALQCDYVII